MGVTASCSERRSPTAHSRRLLLQSLQAVLRRITMPGRAALAGALPASPEGFPLKSLRQDTRAGTVAALPPLNSRWRRSTAPGCQRGRSRLSSCPVPSPFLPDPPLSSCPVSSPFCPLVPLHSHPTGNSAAMRRCPSPAWCRGTGTTRVPALLCRNRERGSEQIGTRGRKFLPCQPHLPGFLQVNLA